MANPTLQPSTLALTLAGALFGGDSLAQAQPRCDVVQNAMDALSPAPTNYTTLGTGLLTQIAQPPATRAAYPTEIPLVLQPAATCLATLRTSPGIITERRILENLRTYNEGITALSLRNLSDEAINDSVVLQAAGITGTGPELFAALQGRYNTLTAIQYILYHPDWTVPRPPQQPITPQPTLPVNPAPVSPPPQGGEASQTGLTNPHGYITGAVLFFGLVLAVGGVIFSRRKKKPAPAIPDTTKDGFLIVREIIVSESSTATVGFRQKEGKTVSNYRLTKQINGGSFGSIYEGELYEFQPGGGKSFTKKVIIKIFSNAPDYREMFGAEWACQGGMDPSNLIVNATAHGITATNKQFIVMEKVRGGDLRDNLVRLQNASQFLNTSQAMDLILQAVEAVAYVHKNGYLHRDIKKENLLLAEPLDLSKPIPKLKLADFGTAIRITPVTKHHKDFAGTPTCMAPEILRRASEQEGGLATTQSDVFSLGVLMYELLTGKAPFLTDKNLAINLAPGVRVFNKMMERFKEGFSFSLRVSPTLQGIVRRALSEDPDKRQKDASVLLEELNNYQTAMIDQTETRK